MQEQTAEQALIILPGLTADRPKLAGLFRFFSQNSPFAVYVPNIPQRRSLSGSAAWLGRYLARAAQPERFNEVHVLAYISGGLVLRRMSGIFPIENLARVVYVRSPIQEQTLQVLRQRYGYFLLWLLRGRLMLDVAATATATATDTAGMAYPTPAYGQGLIIETGVSRLARSMGVSAEGLPGESWQPGRLLPGADDVMRVPESHDDVYTSPSLLGAALHFFVHGRFQESESSTIDG